VHEADRNVAGLQGARRRDLRCRVGAPMQQPRTFRLRVAPRIDQGTPAHPRRAARMDGRDDFGAGRAEAVGFDERPRQAERKSEGTEPRPGRGEPGIEAVERREGFERDDAKELAFERTECQRHRFSPRRVAREVDAGEPHRHQPRARAATPPAMHTAPTTRNERSPSPSRRPPIRAANSIETSRAGATWLSGARRTAYSTST